MLAPLDRQGLLSGPKIAVGPTGAIDEDKNSAGFRLSDLENRSNYLASRAHESTSNGHGIGSIYVQAVSFGFGEIISRSENSGTNSGRSWFRER